MNRLTKRFQTLKKRNEKALIAYLTAGDPSLETSGRLILEMAAAGADVIEIGVPFSDPTADGPIIQQAGKRALEKGANLRNIMELIGALREKTDVPLVLFGYFNPILAFGLEDFAIKAKEAGLDGLLVVDLPQEEAPELRRYTDPAGLAFIPLIAPTSTAKRIAAAARNNRGFIYFISVTGVTGSAQPDPDGLKEDINRIRALTDIPLAVGFGISTPAQASLIAPLADGIVVGSALVEMIGSGEDELIILAKINGFIREMKEALRVHPFPAARSLV